MGEGGGGGGGGGVGRFVLLGVSIALGLAPAVGRHSVGWEPITAPGPDRRAGGPLFYTDFGGRGNAEAGGGQKTGPIPCGGSMREFFFFHNGGGGTVVRGGHSLFPKRSYFGRPPGACPPGAWVIVFRGNARKRANCFSSPRNQTLPNNGQHSPPMDPGPRLRGPGAGPPAACFFDVVLAGNFIGPGSAFHPGTPVSNR